MEHRESERSGRGASPAIAVFALAAVILLAAIVPSAAGRKDKSRNWSFAPDVHRQDSDRGKLKDDEGTSGGGATIVDIFIAPTTRRFRNAPNGAPKRVYRVKAALAVSMKPGYELQGAICSQETPKGSFALTSRKGARLFFPRERSNIEVESSQGSINADLGPFGVTLPLPPIKYHTETTQVGVSIETPSSQRHKWNFDDGDGTTTAERYGFAGHWAAAARRIDVKIRCVVIGNATDGGILNTVKVVRGTTRAERSLNP
jgi:hypothetical protein